ncbi:MAG: hypothetical protein JSR46_01845 [Verrucomicrobia bacterium]|nr:hypothetical protein [Verrucomicrobiota bacterium]
MNDEKDDLELISQSILQNRFGSSSSMQPTSNEPEIERSKGSAFEKGYTCLIEEIKDKAVDGYYSCDADIKPLPIADFQILPEKMQEIKECIEEGLSERINPICSFSADVQLIFYETATHFLEQADFKKSLDAFSFLTMMNPQVQAFWIGLALVYEKNQNIDKAFEHFELAIQSDPSNFTPYYGITRCCETIKDFRKIDQLLEQAKENESIKEEVSELVEYIKLKR